jgi:hypothetical protein
LNKFYANKSLINCPKTVVFGQPENKKASSHRLGGFARGIYEVKESKILIGIKKAA